MLKVVTVAVAFTVVSVAVAPGARAQKEAMGMMYEVQMAPKQCGWKDAADGKKLDANIAAQEKALGVSASEKAAMIKAAEADLKGDPSNCAPDGLLRSMYNEMAK